MQQRHEVNQLVAQWEELYGQLLRLTQKQLQTFEAEIPADDLIHAQEQFGQRWTKIQTKIEALEQSLKQHLSSEEYLRQFQSKIEPLLVEMQENNRQTQVLVQQQLNITGGTIQSAKQHRQATEAYYGQDYEGQTAIFFDEKK